MQKSFLPFISNAGCNSDDRYSRVFHGARDAIPVCRVDDKEALRHEVATKADTTKKYRFGIGHDIVTNIAFMKLFNAAASRVS
jgi:hypothetical protein